MVERPDGLAGPSRAIQWTEHESALWWTCAVLRSLIGDGDTRPALGWSALIVAVVWGVVAAVLAVTGRKEVKEAQGMPRTTETVKKIPDAVKGQDH